MSTGEMYTENLHGIDGINMDDCLKDVVNWETLGDKERFESGQNARGTRVSLTFRDVLKVKKLGKGFGFLRK